MIPYKITRLTFLLLCFFSLKAISAEKLISTQCAPLIENQSATAKTIPYPKGLLWKISKGDKEASYLFGTIHIPDKEVTTLPAAVDKALKGAKQFVMEVVPDLEGMSLLAQSMFFTDGQRLSELVDAPIYDETIAILSDYHFDADVVSVIKPWGAFLTMSYPPNKNQAQPLDFVLLSLAKQNGAAVSGLESLPEQIEIFSQLSLAEQSTLLTDTVCHYDFIKKGFTTMKSLYLNRDLLGLYNYTQRYTISKDLSLDKKLMKKLIVDRNIKMAQRMQPILEKGMSFIAIGALHLPGKEGVLALLEQQGYRISLVF